MRHAGVRLKPDSKHEVSKRGSVLLPAFAWSEFAAAGVGRAARRRQHEDGCQDGHEKQF